MPNAAQDQIVDDLRARITAADADIVAAVNRRAALVGKHHQPHRAAGQTGAQHHPPCMDEVHIRVHASVERGVRPGHREPGGTILVHAGPPFGSTQTTPPPSMSISTTSFPNGLDEISHPSVKRAERREPGSAANAAAAAGGSDPTATDTQNASRVGASVRPLVPDSGAFMGKVAARSPAASRAREHGLQRFNFACSERPP